MSSTEEKASVPLHFQCPISLDLMTDPVTLCTGITYDRAGIEKWLRGGRNTCPVTRQELWSVELIPNHTLHRIIQSWCGATSSDAEKTDSGANREQTDFEQVNRLLQDIKSGKLRVDALRKLRALAREKQIKRRAVAFEGASTVLASLLSLYSEKVKNSHEMLDSCEEIITTLCLLDLTDDAVVLLGDSKTLSCLGWFLRRGSFMVKNDAAYLMGRIATSQRHLLRHLGALPGVLKGLLQLLEVDTCRLASEYNLEVLLVLCSCRRNTIRSIEAGAVSVVVELLSQAQGSCCERALALLQLLLSCAEGRAAAAQHATLVSTIGKKLLRVSDTATELAVGALWELCEYSADSRVRYETLKAGVFPKLVLLLQISCTRRTREKAWELIRLLNIVRG